MQGKFLDMRDNEDYDKLNVAGEIIKNGGIVLFPTETVYGIGANALDNDAVKKIFIAKGRAQDNPLILHISTLDMLDSIAENITTQEYKLMENFWPGPFTIILDKKKNVANEATCNGDTVGVRMPSNRIAYELIKRAGVPIAAPSANISGRPSGTKISDIYDELNNKVDYIIDGGECDIGLESTVVRVIGNEVKILRPGKISKSDIEKVINDVKIDKNVMGQIAEGEKVLSPGMKYRHYAPKTKCVLVYGEDRQNVVRKINELANEYEKVLILALDEEVEEFKKYEVIKLGSKNDLLKISHNIFSALRKIDTYDVDIAIVEGVKPDGVGLAIMNRLIRACEHNYIEV